MNSEAHSKTEATPCPDPSGLGIPCQSSRRWTPNNIPDLNGRRVLITGGANGLGLATARALVARGAAVIIADINELAGKQAATQLQALAPGAEVDYLPLDLGDLAAIRHCAETLNSQANAIDVLINNAGIYPPAQRATTRDGFELKFGINYLGHFALTGWLMPSLQLSARPRVVSVSSITQAWGQINFDDLQAEKKYIPNKVYAQAKLACLMFGLELHARAAAAGSSLQSMVAHPGIARTRIGQERKQHKRDLRARLEDGAQALAMRLFGQEAEQGAWPILYAATAARAESGAFYGPDGFAQFAGSPRRHQPGKAASDVGQRQRLWQISEQLTRVRIRF